MTIARRFQALRKCYVELRVRTWWKMNVTIRVFEKQFRNRLNLDVLRFRYIRAYELRVTNVRNTHYFIQTKVCKMHEIRDIFIDFFDSIPRRTQWSLNHNTSNTIFVLYLKNERCFEEIFSLFIQNTFFIPEWRSMSVLISFVSLSGSLITSFAI